MRSVASIRKSIEMFGYAHLMRDEFTNESAAAIARDNGWRVKDDTAAYTITLAPAERVQESEEERMKRFEKIRREENEKRLKRAAARKKKAQTT